MTTRDELDALTEDMTPVDYVERFGLHVLGALLAEELRLRIRRDPPRATMMATAFLDNLRASVLDPPVHTCGMDDGAGDGARTTKPS